MLEELYQAGSRRGRSGGRRDRRPDDRRRQMRRLSPWADGAPLDLLLIGAHADDIEIGCGGTHPRLDPRGPRSQRALGRAERRRPSARTRPGRRPHAFLRGVPRVDVRVEAFRDGYFPYAGPPLKELFEAIKGSVAAGPHPDPRPRRPPPGPPARRRADLADVPGPPRSSSTRSPSTTASSAGRTSTSTSRNGPPGRRRTCWSRRTRPNAIATGSARRRSWDWPGCAASNPRGERSGGRFPCRKSVLA